MTVHKGGSVRKALTFNAQTSNFDSWFVRTRLTKSSWSDLKTYEPLGSFSLSGFCSRHTHICQNYQISKEVVAIRPGCHEIYGWMFRGTYEHCGWEKAAINKVAYCDQQTICHFQNQGEFRVRGFLMTYYRNHSHKICPGLHAIANIANVWKLAKR